MSRRKQYTTDLFPRLRVRYLLSELLDLLAHACLECSVDIGDHADTCPVREVHRAARAWARDTVRRESDAPGEGS